MTANHTRPDIHTDAWRKLSERMRAMYPRCEHCGSTKDLQLDHVRDRSLVDGLQVLCGPCNRAKIDYKTARAFDPRTGAHKNGAPIFGGQTPRLIRCSANLSLRDTDSSRINPSRIW